jgi:hypothetical protein
MGIVSVTARNVAIGATALAVITGGAVLAVEWDAWFSAPAGAAGVTVKNNNSDNRIAQRQQWVDGYNTVKEDQANIQAAVKNPNLGYSLADLQSKCRADVSSYNNLNEGLTSSDWRPSDLPVALDPAQYCNVS